MVSLGLATGLAGGFWLTRLARGLLYDVSPVDGLTWGAVTLAIIVTGAVATLIAARRAARIDPLIAMRLE